MVSKTARSVLLGALAKGVWAQGNGSVTCSGTFSPVSAADFVASMNPGWNLGNTLDAIETEGSWNNPPVQPATFDDIKALGFKGIRLPVTWAYHFASQAPDWTVDPTWMQRVEDVIDQITDRGFPVIVDVHHDSWNWADVTKATNITELEDRFYKLWHQIGTKLACKGSSVAFEPINEPPGENAEDAAKINKLNNIFLQAIHDAGGFNDQRVVTLVGPTQDGTKTTQFFDIDVINPGGVFKNPWALQYHYYSPYDFIFNAWGKTTWGSAADIASLEADIARVRGNFTDVPLIIGEWAASPVATETAARWRYFDAFLRAAAKYNTATVLWDNGADFLNRATKEWRDPVSIDLYMSAAKGETNSLPDSTTDGSVTTQQSSAYIYHKKNETVSDTTLPFLFNGNTLSSISVTGTNDQLAEGTDYTVAGEDITFKSSFLSSIITPSAPLGTLANLTLTFSEGADLRVNILQYGTPVLGATSSAVPASGDVLIPITWAGQNRPATVRALKADGSYLFDEWTTVLGPLQQARITYEGQWNWNGQNIILPAATVNAVRSGGQSTTFTIEFYPREPGNTANYTLTV